MIRNSQTDWGAVSRLFHWLAAGLVLFLIVHGWWMTEFPPREARFTHYSWHASIGYGAVALMLLRILWQWMNPAPAMPATTPAWEQIAALISHWGVYLLVFAASFSGWALAGTFRGPSSISGGIPGVRLVLPFLAPGIERVVHHHAVHEHLVIVLEIA